MALWKTVKERIPEFYEILKKIIEDLNNKKQNNPHSKFLNKIGLIFN